MINKTLILLMKYFEHVKILIKHPDNKLKYLMGINGSYPSLSYKSYDNYNKKNILRHQLIILFKIYLNEEIYYEKLFRDSNLEKKANQFLDFIENDLGIKKEDFFVKMSTEAKKAYSLYMNKQYYNVRANIRGINGVRIQLDSNKHNFIGGRIYQKDKNEPGNYKINACKREIWEELGIETKDEDYKEMETNEIFRTIYYNKTKNEKIETTTYFFELNNPEIYKKFNEKITNNKWSELFDVRYVNIETQKDLLNGPAENILAFLQKNGVINLPRLKRERNYWRHKYLKYKTKYLKLKNYTSQ